MTRVIRRFALWVGLGLLPAMGLGFGPALAGSGPACAAAASGAPHAALVVDTGVDVTTYCVGLGSTSISGIQLIEKANAQFGLSYRLGFGGQAVCMLNGVGGPQGDDCLTGQSQFWGYWIGSGSGAWTWSSTGAASTSVHDGDVQGWAWGAGLDGTTHPQPPATSLGDVCTPPTTHSPKPPRPGGNSGGNDPSPSPHVFATASPSHGPSAHPSPHHRSPSPHVRPSSPASIVPRATETLAAAGALSSDGGSGGSPFGVLIALGLAGALGVGGWLRVRSGRSRVPR